MAVRTVFKWYLIVWGRLNSKHLGTILKIGTNKTITIVDTVRRKMMISSKKVPKTWEAETGEARSAFLSDTRSGESCFWAVWPGGGAFEQSAAYCGEFLRLLRGNFGVTAVGLHFIWSQRHGFAQENDFFRAHILGWYLVGLGWIGLDWIGLDWVGLKWSWSDRGLLGGDSWRGSDNCSTPILPPI